MLKQGPDAAFRAFFTPFRHSHSCGKKCGRRILTRSRFVGIRIGNCIACGDDQDATLSFWKGCARHRFAGAALARAPAGSAVFRNISTVRLPSLLTSRDARSLRPGTSQGKQTKSIYMIATAHVHGSGQCV